jgi:hypothetical protein
MINTMELSPKQDKMDQIIAELSSDIDEINHNSDTINSAGSTAPVLSEQDRMEQIIAELSNNIDEINHNSNKNDPADPEPVLEKPDKADEAVSDLSTDAGLTDADTISSYSKNQDDNNDSDDFCVLDDEEIEEFDVNSLCESNDENETQGKLDSSNAETIRIMPLPVIDDDVEENEDDIDSYNKDSALKDDRSQTNKQVAGKTAVVVSVVFIVAFISGWFINDMKIMRNLYMEAPDNYHVENIYQTLPASDNSHPGDDILKKSLEEIDRIRNASIEKQKKIANLITYYENSIHGIEVELINEKHEKNITFFQQAITNKKIELGLRTIQRRRFYIENLKRPYEQLLLGIEELFYIKRKTEIDIRMIPFSTGIDIRELAKNIHAIIQKHIITMNNFKIDTEQIQNVQFNQLEAIWEGLSSIKPVQRDNNIVTQYDNETIWKEICNGNFSRINLLTDLSSDAAACLSKWKGKDLYLNGLSTIQPDVVKHLASWKGEWICLNGLSELSPEIAKLLSKWKGKRLSFNGLKELSGHSAGYLSKWKGNQIELVGIEKLPADTSKYLLKWSKSGGTLYMDNKLLKRIK